MPRFAYTARDSNGKKISGSEEAPSQDEAVNQLQTRELIIINIAPEYKESADTLKSGGLKKERLRARRYRVTSQDLTLLCRQLATLLGAGVTILKSVDVIAQQVASRKLYNVLRDLQKNMEAGLSLHEAMAKHPKVFSELWINLVESGEASGNLAVILNRLAAYLEQMAAFRSKVISALVYPMVLFCAGIFALLFLTIKIVPTFAELFKGFNIELPLLTRWLLRVSIFIRQQGPWIILFSVIGVFTLKKYVQTKKGRRLFDQLKFKLPLFSSFFRALTVERFSSEMATLIESGVPILYSLEITEHSVGNTVVAEIVRQIKEDVREGRPLHQTMETSDFFEPMAVQMVTVGEEIGELSQMFKKINSFYREYMEMFLTRFTTLFEPAMLVFMGAIIGLMVIGMFLPIFQIAQISGG